MMIDIIVALIAFSGSVIGTFAGITVNSKLTNYRIEQLEKKQDAHNKVIERVYEIEQHNAVTDEDIKVINDRIADLEDMKNA